MCFKELHFINQLNLYLILYNYQILTTIETAQLHYIIGKLKEDMNFPKNI